MGERIEQLCTAFEGARRIASGELAVVAAAVKAVLDRGERAPVLIFDDQTSHPVEVDFRGTVDDVLRRIGEAAAPAAGPGDAASGSASDPASAVAQTPGAPPADAPRGPGRPKLGVVPREVTLLPRHWDWLNSQPGGASVALRKLVEEARRANEGKDRIRRSQEVAYRFMSAMAGNEPGFEESTRALFAGDRARFDEQTSAWPEDVRDHARKLATAAFPGSAS
jgi:hypothetical protein